MKRERPQRKPERTYVDTDTLVDALNKLCESGEYEKLMRYGYYRMRGIRGWVVDTDAQNLLHEAIIRTRVLVLDKRRAPKGIRAWNPDQKSLFEHLLGSMRSIANEFAKNGGRFAGSSEWIASPEDVHSPVENRAEMQRLRAALRGDKLAVVVLESILNGEQPQEACERLEIAPWEYEKRYKRVIRRGKALFGPKRGKK